MGME
jgi:hypothetical protein